MEPWQGSAQCRPVSFVQGAASASAALLLDGRDVKTVEIGVANGLEGSCYKTAGADVVNKLQGMVPPEIRWQNVPGDAVRKDRAA